MNKKLALLLAVIFIGTTALPVDKKAEPKKEKKVKTQKVREYKLSVKNKILNTEAKVIITDTTGKTYPELTVPGKKTESVKTDKKVKIQKVEVAIVGGGTTTADIKAPYVKKVRIIGTKEAPKVEEAKKCKKCATCKCDKPCKCKKGKMSATCKCDKPCKCTKDKVAKKEKKAEKKAKKEMKEEKKK